MTMLVALRGYTYHRYFILHFLFYTMNAYTANVFAMLTEVIMLAWKHLLRLVGMSLDQQEFSLMLNSNSIFYHSLHVNFKPTKCMNEGASSKPSTWVADFRLHWCNCPQFISIHM